MEDLVSNIFTSTDDTFAEQALNIFHYQYANNAIYKSWVDALGVTPTRVNEPTQIPFLPISFFKTHKVVTGNYTPQAVFESSGTTGNINSRHFVKDVELYKQSFIEGFRRFYGEPGDWCIIGLLPSYLERTGSSLVMMVDELIKLSGNKHSGFYLYEYEKLANGLLEQETWNRQTLVIGVTYALLDFAEKFPMELKHTTIMETGGMKGRRKEMVRDEVHSIIREQLAVPVVHSEYGMTELLSQAYSFGDGLFKAVPWMKVLLRDEDDPLKVFEQGRGLINVIDFANIHSCSFIATDDAGRIDDEGRFEVIGRHDNSDVRGCSLMVM